MEELQSLERRRDKKKQDREENKRKGETPADMRWEWCIIRIGVSSHVYG
jgi:hypothetical protein